ncbi:RT0821/Lpp0805 family surface protein [Amorphus orientalis]|uniref:Surface antigen domain-containing protein n=1 Tax=Amorphus orientalis TaxID=649198 RepID=A0AAE4ATJ1_9HYPH|nr:RT0821/Lpp0805 family surface protein [Amorphus orientalis]MDQ0317336.1 hypothetical protein [Amorphus orientalis]
MSIDACARYIAPRARRHRTHVAVLVSCVTLGGCAFFGGSETMLAASDTTASVAAQPDPLLAETGLDTADLDALAFSLGSDPLTPEAERTWSNPEAGTTGRLIEVTDVPAPSGGLCRSFVTSVNAPSGLFLLSGIGCRREDGNWVIDGLAPATSAQG